MRRKKVGEIATASLTVDIRYRCSSCGEENITKDTLKETVQTATIGGINIKNDVAGEARRSVRDKLAGLLGQIDPHRFRDAELSCKCINCGHKEPWARMNYDHLKKLNDISKITIILSIFLLMVPWRTATAIYVLLTLFILGAASWVGIILYKSKNTEKMEQLIDTLPAESLPTVLPRINPFNYGSAIHRAEKTTYDTWVCRECGTHNSLQYAQCKKCGKYKGS